MQLAVGQKVSYPNQGVCLVEEHKNRIFGAHSMSGYFLRVLGDNSTIFVPDERANSVGLRPLISRSQCRKLIDKLSEDFEPASGDWKSRAKDFTEKLRSGDVFLVADVFKMLTYLSHEKKLSFREQTLLERSKFLIVSEITNTCARKDIPLESDIVAMVENACNTHGYTDAKAMSALIH